jgi:AAA domain/DnaB-like helicase N terminal domain
VVGFDPGESEPLVAERRVLGACMISAEAVRRAIEDYQITTGHFGNHRHSTLWAAIVAAYAADTPVEPYTLARQMDPADLNRLGGVPFIRDILAEAPAALNVGYYARLILDAADARRLEEAGLRLTQAAEVDDPGRRHELAAQVRDSLSALLGAVPIGGVDATELSALLAVEDDEEYDWLVPGLLERRDRVILTGKEGTGKSTLLRQIAVQLAAGIHPFTTAPIDPVKVLLIDLENGERHVKRKLRALYLAAGKDYAPEPGLHVRCRPEGIDLLVGEDVRWLAGLVGALAPDLLITGPIYKLAGGDPTEEATARAVVKCLDRLRADVGLTLILEAHSPHASGGPRRPERPYGASLWLRWPEFGMFLAPEGELRHWRGARDERAWPHGLARGGAWPWTPVSGVHDSLWHQIRTITLEAGEYLTQRNLATLTEKSQATVSRAIREHQVEYDSLFSDQLEGPGLS